MTLDSVQGAFIDNDTEACLEFSSFFWDAPQITGRSAVSQNVCCYLTISLLRALSASCACLWLEAGHRRQTEPGVQPRPAAAGLGEFSGMCSLCSGHAQGTLHLVLSGPIVELSGLASMSWLTYLCLCCGFQWASFNRLSEWMIFVFFPQQGSGLSCSVEMHRHNKHT